MAERGARPHVHPVRKWLLHAVRRLFTPLEPDHYLEMINPLWSTRELRGRVDRVVPECEDTASILIRPAYEWPGHKPGQYVRLGVIIDGVYHWRAYSLTSDPDPRDGLIRVTPKLVEGGVVSPYLVRKIAPGDIVRLGEVEGVFTLPDPVPARLLFVSAGSGITPIMSMLRSLDHRELVDDVVVVHSASTPQQVVFSSELRDLSDRHPGMKVEVWISGEKGHITPADLDEICPDWRERETFASGPRELLDVLEEHWNEHGDPERFNLERFQPVIGGNAGSGEGGTIHFLDSEQDVECDGGTPILVAGENAGLKLPYGCRIGICHTCVGTLRSGQLRDLRTDEVSEPTGASVRTCIHTAEGDIEIEL